MTLSHINSLIQQKIPSYFVDTFICTCFNKLCSMWILVQILMHWLRSDLAEHSILRNLIWGNRCKGFRGTEEPKEMDGMTKQPAGRPDHLHILVGFRMVSEPGSNWEGYQARLGLQGWSCLVGAGTLQEAATARHVPLGERRGWKWSWNLLSACPSVFCSWGRKMEFAGSVHCDTGLSNIMEGNGFENK